MVLVFVLLSVVDSVLVLVFEDNESINVDLTFNSTCSTHFAGNALKTLVKAGSHSSSETVVNATGTGHLINHMERQTKFNPLKPVCLYVI